MNNIARSAMALACPHCARVNSSDARFCYFDGASLLVNAGPVETARRTFLAPFVFPTGVTCVNYDEFAHGCQAHWDTAVDLLHQGTLQTFFSGLGRLDLAQAAQEAANFPDRDRGLDLFLARLPTTGLSLPKLEVRPKLINLGTLKIGQDKHLALTLENQGTRIVFGSVATTVPWLAATDSGESKLFQFRDNASIVIHVKGQHLRAAVKPLEGTIVIESNAGMFKLKVLASVPITPYPDGVLAGAKTPREIAERAKGAPRQAAPSFEKGEVAEWYQANGWTYPVQGPNTSGLAAVQQFFEALGISKPPKVTVGVAKIALTGKAGEQLACKLELRTEEGRAVYAHAVSPVPWIVVKPAILLGTVAAIPLEIVVPAEAGQTFAATLRVLANGQQRFDIPVEVTAENAIAAATLAPPIVTAATPAACGLAFAGRSTNTKPQAASPASANPPALAATRPPIKPIRVLVHLAPLALLGVAVLGLIALDALRKPEEPLVLEEASEIRRDLPGQASEFTVAIHDEPDIDPPVVPVVRFKIEDEPEERFARLPPPPVTVDIKDEPGENNGPEMAIAAAPLVSYSLASPPKTFGISGTATAGATRPKQLTYSRIGDTNTTVVSVNGGNAEFGGTQGKWTRLNQPLANIIPTPGAIQATQSTWTWGPIAYHQVLEVVPGQPVTVGNVSRRQLDAVLVRWVIQNNDRTARSAGLRLQLDTLIGGNDGVPFTVPGYTGLVNTFADFRQAKDVPDFIQALERPNLKSPGTVAHLTLKVGPHIEPPSRASLTYWPGNSLAWDIPVRNLAGDSAVILYWPEKTLKAGATRTIGFSYGLGNVSSNDKLGVTLGGSFEPGQNFTVTAYVENPIAGQTLKLDLPEGLSRSEGAETQSVALGNGKTSIVTWKVVVERTGEFRLKVNSSTGISQAKTISIARAAAPTGGKLALDLQGAFEPGQVFTVIGKVNEPRADQTLTLHLPAGLQKVSGVETQKVPAPPAGSKDAVVEWKVRVIEPGKYPVRVSSSTGIAQTKTISIVQPTRGEGTFQILLTGDFAPQKEFTVSTAVTNPAPEQKLTLVLADGLERSAGDETRVVQAGTPISWKVKVREPGKFLVGVKSTTGVTQRKTVVIEPPSDAAGRFNFDLTGEIRPGKEFLVKAQVTNPLANQTLTLVLPKGLQLTEGDATQTVPAPAEANDVSLLIWKVRVTESGRLPVRVESSTRLVRTKTITLSESSGTLFDR